MPRKIDLHPCACGCDQLTNATWAQGHDQRQRIALEKALEAAGYSNGLMALRELVERTLRRKVRPGPK